MTTTLIRDARIVDGSGAPPTAGDVLIEDGAITAVGTGLKVPTHARVVDAEGRVVCPGFIDMHSHVDMLIGDYPRADGMLRQGVTTIVTGNCGISPFPDGAEAGAQSRKPSPGRGADLSSWVRGAAGLGLAINLAPLVGHGSLRRTAMADSGSASSEAELAAMRALVAQAMEQGAWGMSTGLIYDPGRFSDTDEIVALASVFAGSGGFYASHIRSESDRLVEAVTEAIEIGRRSGVPVQISHHKAMRRDNWGTVEETLGLIDEAIADGVDVTLDAYPYTASSTGLWAHVPSWARADDLLAEGAGELRERFTAEMEGRHPGRGTHADDLVIAAISEPGELARYEGAWLVEAAEAEGLSPGRFAASLLLSGRHVQVIDHSISPEDMRRVFEHPRCMVGSDAQRIHAGIPGKPHPRNFGTFPRFMALAHEWDMPLETAIHKATGLPARRLGWTGEPGERRPDPARRQPVRGLLRPGAAADVLMFNPEDISDHATFEDPQHYSTGFALIMVGGEVVVHDDVDTGASPGRMLLRR